jgi:hypothetical protein
MFVFFYKNYLQEYLLYHQGLFEDALMDQLLEDSKYANIYSKKKNKSLNI